MQILPSAIWPPPKHKPRTVTNQSVAAVVTPSTKFSRFRITPPPMNPIPDKIPSGRRITSIVTNESAGLPALAIRMLAWIIGDTPPGTRAGSCADRRADRARPGSGRSTHRRLSQG